MRILLIGEFSGFHRYLKEGLLEIGNDEITLVSNGDGTRQIGGADLPIYPVGIDGNNRFRALRKNKKIIRSLCGYDMVQFINTNVYPAYYNEWVIDYIKENNRCLSLVSAGDDYALHRAYESGCFEYYIFDYIPMINFNRQTMRGRLQIKSALHMERSADIIIPICYEYSKGYTDGKRYKALPIPINTDAVKYQENIVDDKVIFFHGITREMEKGTPTIRLALERLKRDYPNDVEVIMDGNMPFEQYLNVLKKTNVVIDQCNGYSYGVNACLAMAQGKVTLSGFRQECLEALGVADCPGISIKPSVEQIYSQLCYVVEHRKDIPEWGYNSRKYIEENHHYVKVAQAYLEAWKSTGKL